MLRLVLSQYRSIAIVLSLLAMTAAVHSQPHLTIKSISVNQPTVTIQVGAYCNETKSIPKSSFTIKDGGKDVTLFTLNCPDTNFYHCCFSTALVIDRSGSMGWGSPSWFEGAKSGAKSFFNKLDGVCDEATLVSFSTTVRVDVNMTKNKASLLGGIDTLVAVGGSAIWDAALTGITEVKNKGTQPCRAIILLTDGEDNASNSTVDDAILLAAQNNVRVYTIGLGTALNEAALKSLANATGGTFSKATSASQLIQIFEQLYRIIAQNHIDCTIEYQINPPCFNGSQRTVEITLGNLPACPGTSTVTANYPLPIDSSTFTVVDIKVGDAQTCPGATIDVPITLLTPVSGQWTTGYFELEIDRGKFPSVQFIWNGLFGITAYEVQPGAGKHIFRFIGPKLVSGSGVLLTLRLTLATPLVDQDIVVPITSWLLQGGCLKPNLIPGIISVRNRRIDLNSPAPNQKFCAGSTMRIEWSSVAVNELFIKLSTDGGQTFSQQIARVTAANTLYDWQIPATLPPGNLYQIQLVDADVGTVYSNPRLFEISNVLSVTTAPADQLVCPNDSAALLCGFNSASVSSIRWQMKALGDTTFKDMSGETSTTLFLRNITPAMHLNEYRAIGTALCGSVATPRAVLSVVKAPTIVSSPKDEIVCVGSPVNFTVNATGANVLYQWRKDGIPIPSATNSNLRLQNASASDGGSYDVVVYNSCPNSSSTSTPAILTVGTTPIITVQPRSDTLCVGAKKTFDVAATGAKLRFQWRKNGIDISGATGSSFLIPAITLGDAAKYDARITDSCGNQTTSASADLLVNLSPTILSHPSDVSICVGATATFSVTAASVTSYQWFKDGVLIPGVTTNTLTIFNSSLADIGSYMVQLTNPCGTTPTNAARLDVVPPTSITQQPQGATVKEGASVTLTVTASGGNLLYQWKKNGVDIPGATNATLTITTAKKSDEGEYTVSVTGKCGSPVLSQLARLNVTPVSVKQTSAIPARPTLDQNYPNPFGPASPMRATETSITFMLPQRGTIRLLLLDLLGREVQTLATGDYSAGEHTITFMPRSLPAGMYIYRLEAEKQSTMRRLTYLR